ncbi:uncharacterized protein [Panulirus ornatus]|uniref:uncharacterized protein n=1 Tax=Panulirus ornatus TaxID=150431 RepID=UPI003A85833B
MSLMLVLLTVRALVMAGMSTGSSVLKNSEPHGGVVGMDAPQCVEDGMTLSCDYWNYTQVVYIDEGLGSLVHKVVVSHARRLNMSEGMCVNLTINNVTDLIVVEDEGGEPCKVNLELTARDSTLNRLPRWTSQMHLEDSTVNLLASDASIIQLTVVNSAIKVINISQPLQEGATATFLSSSIDTLERLIAERGSDILLYKTTVGVVSPIGLLLNGGNVTLRESSTATASGDSVLITPGSSLRLENYTGSLTVEATMNATSVISETRPSKRLCHCEPENPYFGMFVAMLILLLCLSIVAVFTGISFQRRKDRSGSSVRSFSGYIRRKMREMSADDFATLLLQREIGCDCLLALEKLRYRVVSSLHTEKLLHQALVTEIDRKFEAELVRARKDAQDKHTHLESCKATELGQIEELFNQEIGKPTRRNWDKVKHILERRKVEEEKLIHEKTREKIYDAEHHDNVQKLERKVCTVKENKEFITKLANLGRQTLSQWRKIIESSDVSLDANHHSRKLLLLMESLLQSRQNDMESRYERQIEEQDKKYLSDMKLQEKGFVGKCAQLEKDYREGCHKIFNEQKKELDALLSTDKLLEERIEELYQVKTRIRDVRLSLDVKKAQETYSERNLRVQHLDSVVQIQRGHMEDMERLIEVITDAQKFYVQVMRQSLAKGNDEGSQDEEEEDLERQPEDLDENSEEEMRFLSGRREEACVEDGSEGLHRHVEDLGTQTEE